MIWKKVRIEIEPGNFQYFIKTEGIGCCRCGIAKHLDYYLQFGLVFFEKYRLPDFMCAVCATWKDNWPQAYYIFGGYFG